MIEKRLLNFIKEAINSGLKSSIDKQNEVNKLCNNIFIDLNVHVSLYYNNWPDSGPSLKISSIQVPKESRNKGLGTKAMQKIIQYADMNNMKIFLTPVTDWGSAKGRLTNFYKSFGFVKNSGKNKDWHSQESMIRFPQK